MYAEVKFGPLATLVTWMIGTGILYYAFSVDILLSAMMGGGLVVILVFIATPITAIFAIAKNKTISIKLP